jgi:hypothetical protein
LKDFSLSLTLICLSPSSFLYLPLTYIHEYTVKHQQEKIMYFLSPLHSFILFDTLWLWGKKRNEEEEEEDGKKRYR